MKKILMLATLALTVGAFTGCTAKTAEVKPAEEAKPAVEEAKAEEGASKEETSVTLWTYPVGEWGKSETVDSIVKAFNEKYPEIKVSVEYLDYSTGDDQVNTAIEGGKAPDMVLEGPERLVANWGAKGYMVDLSDLFALDASKDIFDNVKAACKSKDGKFYEYPFCMVAHSMAINKKIFEDADALKYVDLENNSWTTENFFKAVDAIYASGHENVAAIYCNGQGGDQGTRAIINNLYSGKFTNEDHTEYLANSEENIKAIEELKAHKGINFDSSIAGADEISLFRNGTLAMAFCWNAAQQINKDNAPAGKTNNGDDIIPMLFPTDDGKVELCGGIWGFGVFDNGDQAKIDASKKFIEFVTTDADQAKKSVLASTFFPVRPSLSGVYEGTENAEIMSVFEKNFLPAFGDYYQVVSGWAEARTAWWNMLQKIGSGEDVKGQVEQFTSEANAAAKK